MGRERDRLIRRLGGIPISDRNLSEELLMRERMETYSREGRLPPEVRRFRNLLVGYGTLLSSDSVASTVGDAARTATFLPVVVPGYRRLFNLRPEHYRPSLHLSQNPVEVAAMNVMPWEESQFNGLAFPVSEDDLEALDARERYYDRIKTPILGFPERTPLGDAWIYSASPNAPAVFDPGAGLLPHWRDIVLAREGAYTRGEAFGRMFDDTTYMADGRTLVVEAYREDLPAVSSPGRGPAPRPGNNAGQEKS